MVLQAAKLLEDAESIHFVFIGGGTMAASLRDQAGQLELRRVHFLPAFPFSEMSEIQADADVGLVIQKANVLDVNLPSKIPVIMACGRPIIAAVNPSGDAYRILEDSQAAILVTTGDATALADAVKDLAGDTGRADRMGEWGRAYAVDHFSQPSSVAAYVRILDNVVEAKPA